MLDFNTTHYNEHHYRSIKICIAYHYKLRAINIMQKVMQNL